MSVVKRNKRGKYNQDKVYKFIYDNPGLNGIKVSKATGISTDHIYFILNKLIDDNRILKYEVIRPNRRYKSRVANKYENKYFASEAIIR